VFVRSLILLVFSALAGVVGLRAQSPAPDSAREWIEPATGHRVVRLSREPGSTKLYFHQNAFTEKGDRMLIVEPRGLAIVDLTQLPHRADVEPLVEGRAANVIVGKKTRRVF
jgi:oligogalacturonide lyase